MLVCKVNRILGGLFPSRPTRRQKKGWHGLRQQHDVPSSSAIVPVAHMLGRSSGEAMHQHQHQHQHQEYQQRQRQAREGALSIGTTARASIGTVATVCSGRHPSRQSHVLKCNRCVKPLATTCYLCKCDCIFCEGEFLLVVDTSL